MNVQDKKTAVISCHHKTGGRYRMKNFHTYCQLAQKFPDREMKCIRSPENEGKPGEPGGLVPYLVDSYWEDEAGNIWLKEHTINHMIPHFASKFYVEDNGEPEKGAGPSEETAWFYLRQAEKFCETRDWKKSVCIFPDDVKTMEDFRLLAPDENIDK